jgi:hypothetical protein
MEKEIFVRLAVCVNPQKAAAAGLSAKALRSFGVGVTNITDDERRHREALKQKVFATAGPISSDDEAHIIPGLGPHPEARKDRQFRIDIPADELREVLKKIVRGCEYWLANGRIIEPPYEIEVLLAPAANLPVEVAQLIARFGPVHQGPGFRIRRGAAQDDSGSVLYEIAIWDTIDVYATILPPEISGGDS